jgi:hypothetical protein
MSEEGLSYLAKPLRLSTASVSLWLIHEVKKDSYEYDLNLIDREARAKVPSSSYDSLLSLIGRERVVVTIEGGIVRNVVDPYVRLSPSPPLAILHSSKNYELISRYDLIDELYHQLVTEVPFKKRLFDGCELRIDFWMEVVREKCGCCSKLIVRDQAKDRFGSMQYNGVATFLAYVFLYSSNLYPRVPFVIHQEDERRISIRSQGSGADADNDNWSFEVSEPLKKIYSIVEKKLVMKKEVLA